MTSEQRERIAYDLSMGLWDDDEQQAAVSALLTAHDALQAQLAEARAEVEGLRQENQMAWNTCEAADTRANRAEAAAARWQAEYGKAVEAIRAAHRASSKYEAWVPCPCEWCSTPAPTGDGPHTPASGEGEGRK